MKRVVAVLLLAAGCGYTTRLGVPAHLHTVYVAPFTNKIDITAIHTDGAHLPLYRHGMEIDLASAVVDRYQFTGILRPTNTPSGADARVNGDLLEFRRDALRYDASQHIEEWRLSVVAHVTFTDLTTGAVMWDEPTLTGDTTYFAIGPQSESEATAVARALTDLARRVIERSTEDW